MKKTFFFLLFIGFMDLSLHAKHLVGGDITYQYLGTFNGLDRYRIKITILRDCVPGNTEFDDPLEATLYNAGNFSDWQTISFSYPGETLVPLTSYNPCSTPPEGICYSVATYVKNIDVTPNANGYYLVYERCCRNNTINNLSNPGAMGMTLSCYIPGSQLKNSSPVFGALPPVFICLGDTFIFPQAAIDPDGDDLVYQLSTPYHGGSQQDPAPSPDAPPPFPFVTFAPGFNLNNMLGNSPQPLVINQNGQLLAICNTPGQFVFAVSVFEYRNNVLISETKRDIQVNVVNCPPNLPPTLNFSTNSSIIGDTLIFTEGNYICFNFQVRDPNSRDSVFADLSSFIFNNPITNASFSFQSALTPVSGQICWKAPCEFLDSIFTVNVTLYDNYTCNLNINTYTFYAKVVPGTVPSPSLNCVSVLQNNEITLNFPYNFDANQDKVYIYRQTNGSSTWQLVDSLNPPINSYTDNSINNANLQSYCYKIVIRKNCNGVLSLIESNSLCTILILNQNIDVSTEQISWTNFIPSTSTTVTYNLELLENGNTSTIFNVTSPYLLKRCNFNGKVRIKAITGSCESYTAFSDYFTLNNEPPSAIELCYVSVADNNAGVEIEWTKSNDTNLKGYEIWRQDNNSWSKITMMDTNSSYYLDTSAQVKQKSYRYYVKAIDDCDAFAKTNEYATILLKSYSEPYFVDLNWTPYINDFPVISYVLLKNQTTRNDFIEDESLTGNNFQYTDNSIDKSKGIYCYKIKANAPGNCGSISYSNSVCETFPIIIYVPNAFTPNKDGKNDEFKIFAEFVEYFNMKIFDRWGKLIYELVNPTQTWDGTYNNKPCPEDVYVYIMETVGYKGESIRKSGSITLLR